MAVHVGRIATGEIEDDIRISGRAGGKTAGGDARAAKLAPNVRADIASKAAKARWSHRETVGDMNNMQTTKGTGADGHEAVRMYSNNSLKEPVRGFEETFSGYELLKKRFSK
ncbi:hypothetical protein [Sphingomonas sp.]|uniref:hypothetical protein n=1 Tax=Sphingomonas sp. TaxID=28214 RepID=UPI0035BC1E14